MSKHSTALVEAAKATCEAARQLQREARSTAAQARRLLTALKRAKVPRITGPDGKASARDPREALAAAIADLERLAAPASRRRPAAVKRARAS